jgi:hypothetical protein
VVAALPSVSSAATDVVVGLSLDAVPNGPVYSLVNGRRIGAEDYSARAKVLATGAVELTVLRSGTTLSGGTLPGVTLAAGQQLLVRLQTSGTSPTTVRARAWKAGTTEPTTWFATATDSTAALQAPGAVGLSTYLSSSATNGPVVARWDDLRVTRL